MSKQRVALGLEAKLAAVERLAGGESATALARELGISRQRLYDWHAVVRSGEDLRVVGRPRPEAAVARLRRVDELTAARARSAVLERKVVEQALELDFFRQALRQVAIGSRPVEALRQVEPGATASTPSSRRGRSRKASSRTG